MDAVAAARSARTISAPCRFFAQLPGQSRAPFALVAIQTFTWRTSSPAFAREARHTASFPQWQPSFISGYAPEDRCHLNGLGLRDGQVRYVTALGTTDTAGGWRANKKDGGVLIDVTTNEVLLRGLSMPHSPRWYADRLWLLESGNGGFGFAEPSGRYQEVARLPGFTRGLTFAGPLAFIGLSQVRESAVFGGIAIAEQPMAERRCSVWVVNLSMGQTVAFVKFEEAVQERFAVHVLGGTRFPDLINANSRLIADSFVLPDLGRAEVLAGYRS